MVRPVEGILTAVLFLEAAQHFTCGRLEGLPDALPAAGGCVALSE